MTKEEFIKARKLAGDHYLANGGSTLSFIAGYSSACEAKQTEIDELETKFEVELERLEKLYIAVKDFADAVGPDKEEESETNLFMALHEYEAGR